MSSKIEITQNIKDVLNVEKMKLLSKYKEIKKIDWLISKQSGDLLNIEIFIKSDRFEIIYKDKIDDFYKSYRTLFKKAENMYKQKKEKESYKKIISKHSKTNKDIDI